MKNYPQAMAHLQPRLWLASGPPASFQLKDMSYARAPFKTATALAVCIYVYMYRCMEVTTLKIVFNIHRLRKFSVTLDGDGDGDGDGNDDGDDDDGNDDVDGGDDCHQRD